MAVCVCCTECSFNELQQVLCDAGSFVLLGWQRVAKSKDYEDEDEDGIEDSSEGLCVNAMGKDIQREFKHYDLILLI